MSSPDLLTQGIENVQPQALTFERAGFYVIASILAWRVFWQLADVHDDNPNAQILAWMAVGLALWLAETY